MALIEVESRRRPNSIRFAVHPATKWTEEIVAGAIFAIWENGESIRHNYLQVNHASIYRALRNKPGGLRKILEVAGIDPQGG